ncbi:MAG: M66 family metalloprotease [Gemmatimonadota bacterium]|nr:M66 family metalloprotease [Gemmatimonadota bacterium]
MWKSMTTCLCLAVTLVAATWTGDFGIVVPQSVSAQGASCPGDFNGDGKVNLADFLAFAGGFGTRSGDANFNARLDMDGSGSVDLSDFLAFAGVFGTNCEDRPRGSVSGDRAALVALYNATDGPNWVDNTNWLTDAPLGEWYGVETDASGRVIKLDVRGPWGEGGYTGNGLLGSIPPDMGKLTNLEHLALFRNSLRGPIPRELGKLARLNVLWLNGNRLDGPIPPELGKLATLEYLSLAHNRLTGRIPPELGNLTELLRLDLDKNHLTGPIPPELGRLANLQQMWLSRNNLSARIPPELGNLRALQVLGISANRVSGPIPPELGKLTNLQSLNLHGNRLTGTIPAELKDLAGLSFFSVDSNQLTGRIPEWLRNLTNLEGLALSWNNLTGPIPPWLGTLTNLESLNLSRSGLTGSIPPELGRLTNLRRLGLGGNELTGSLPAELADLTNLEELEVSSTLLTGPLPKEFLNLTKLTSFGCANDYGFCVPGTRAFSDWIERFESFEVTWCNQSDSAVLESLWEATDGPDWRESDGWLGGPVLGEWHGVGVDTLGRVTEIDLENNDLAGFVPSYLGHLSELTELRIGDNNALSGRLPLSLAGLPLSTLHYGGTDVCYPADDSFREWLNGVGSHNGTGVLCAPLTEREILVEVWRATGGPGWGNSDKWMTDALLGEWNGVETDDSGRIVGLDLSDRGLSGPIPPSLEMLVSLEQLDLSGNDLSGPIPPELGHLKSLKSLALVQNDLSGPIPPELGTLANLEKLYLYDNDLSGPIPSELGHLDNLKFLHLAWNDLSGAIPAKLGNIAGLSWLDLRDNNLSGPIPAELGAIASLSWLDLSGNSLSGPIPVELGRLVQLRTLRLGVNDLSGSVPPELRTLVNLNELDLANNTGLSGALPPSLTSLRSIDAILARGTDLCVPLGDAGFRSWLNAISDAQIASCAPSAVYLTQAVQSRTLPVPLVADEDALLRVFVTSSRGSGVGMPPVRAHIYLNRTETHTVDVPGTSVPIPASVDESDLSISANAVIPAQFVQPGLEMVVEVDPDGTLDPALGLPERIPEAGRLPIDVRKVPVFDLTVIPFLWTPDPDSIVIGIARAMAADPEGHELLQETLTLLPVAAIDVTAHAPVMSSSNSGFDVLRETAMIRILEGGGRYMGLMTEFSDVGGVAYLSGLSSVSIPVGDVIAHELGHTMSLEHAPCASPNSDPRYPYPDGTIGAVGYDFAGEYDLFGGGGLVEAWRYDLMSYCGPPNWVSDYSFNKALDHRLANVTSSAAKLTTQADPVPALLVWGGRDKDGVPFLDPAFVVDAMPTLPPAGGDYTVEAATGVEIPIFSYTFDMPVTACAEGEETSFVFALPLQPEWAGNLASVRLSGPGGDATLDGSTDQPMAILRDLQTGQVRGFLSDLTAEEAAQAAEGAFAAKPGMEVIFSRGIPDLH